MYNNDITKKRISQAAMPPEWETISEGVSSGIIKKVTYYKWINTRVVDALKKIGEEKKAQATDACGTWIEILPVDGRERIIKANFCRERVCQVCAWRRSMKFVAQMLPVLKALEKEYKFIFVTLTIKNVEGAKAGAAVTQLLEAWNKLYRRRAYTRAWLGFVRSVEVTYNTEDKEYHPHIHALVAVKKSYGAKWDKNYISFEQLRKDWAEVANLDYLPNVYLSLVRAREASDDKKSYDTTNRAALETMKYAFKVKYDAINDETISVFMGALKNRRLISFGGVVAKKRIEVQEIQSAAFEEECKDNVNLATVLYKFSPAGWSIEENEIPEAAGAYEIVETPYQYSLDEIKKGE